MSSDHPPTSESTARPQSPPRSGAAAPNGNGARRRRRILAGVGILLLLGLGLVAYWYFFMYGIVYTDDARIGGHLVDLAPEVNGTLVAVDVHEGKFVHKGTVVFELNPAIPEAALKQAEAALVAARADVASNDALYQKTVNGNRPEQIKAAEATFRALRDQEELARLNFERSQVLFKNNTISQDAMDSARTAYETARQNRENAQQNMILMQQGSRKEDIAAAKAALELSQSKEKQAEAAVQSARADLARYTVRAPFDGWVVRRWLNPGAMPLAAQPVVSLFDPATIRVDANIEEQDLDNVQVGDRVDISVDAFPDLHFTGRVAQIMRAVNSDFSLIPSEGVAGTFIKVTQRVPLRINFSHPPPASIPLGPGLSVEVHIYSGTAPARSAKKPAHE